MNKHRDKDQGSSIAIYVKDNHVIIEFTKPINWLAFNKAEAVRIAAGIIEKANSIKVIGHA